MPTSHMVMGLESQLLDSLLLDKTHLPTYLPACLPACKIAFQIGELTHDSICLFWCVARPNLCFDFIN